MSASVSEERLTTNATQSAFDFFIFNNRMMGLVGPISSFFAGVCDLFLFVSACCSRRPPSNGLVPAFFSKSQFKLALSCLKLSDFVEHHSAVLRLLYTSPVKFASRCHKCASGICSTLKQYWRIPKRRIASYDSDSNFSGMPVGYFFVAS